jgi:methyl-accepting chemotaxis protein
MDDNYFKVLFRSAVASGLALVLAAVASAKGLPLPPWFAVVCALVPMAVYHLYLSRRASRGLSAAAIDSIYYFGFLVTVAALGISALSIAMGGAAESLSTVIYQFGVGLLATGYAVIARMHLTAQATLVDAASPEAILDRYVKRSLELVDNVEMASVRLASFSETMMAKTADVSEASRTAAERAMLEVARTFENEMKSTLSLARDGISEIRAMVSDTSFNAEREQLAKSVRASIDAVTGLNQALEHLAASSKQRAQATDRSSATADRLDESLVKLVGHIEQMAGEDGALVRAGRNVAQASSSVEEAVVVMSGTVEAVNNLGRQVEEAAPAFKTMAKLSKKAHEQLETIGASTERLDSALSGMLGTADAADKLARGLALVNAALPALAAKADSLGTNLHKTDEAAEKLQGTLSLLPEDVGSLTTLSSAVAQALKEISDRVAVTVEQAKTIGASGQDAARTVEAAQQLMAGTNQLQQHVAKFSELMQQTQRSLTDTTGEVRLAMKASADALEADVRRSSHASQLLTESLTQVARTIVEQTRLRQGLPA